VEVQSSRLGSAGGTLEAASGIALFLLSGVTNNPVRNTPESFERA
jgi:hypothetical protein